MPHKPLTRAPLLTLVVFLAALSPCCAQNRDLAEIRYRFTPCGTSGRSGPSFSACEDYYDEIKSPITQQDLLFEFENREYEGAQGFRVSENGIYNITVAGARGGRGICNGEHGGFGYLRTVQVELSTDFDLLVLVGERGTGPCDVIPEDEEIYDVICREPPATIPDVERCNETWYNFIRDFDRSFYEAFGGGAGGGGSLVRARRRDTKVFDSFPIAIVGGGGGTSSVLDYSIMGDISSTAVLPIFYPVNYQVFVNAHTRTSDPEYGTVGVRGIRLGSGPSNSAPGAGGGYSPGIFVSIDVDGRPLGRAQNFAEGGLDCTQSLRTTRSDIPYSGVYGGFGGGGGACGGGGGGGGYTGGAILERGVTVPGEGGYSYIGNSFVTNFRVNTVDDGRLNRESDDGFVEIALANCGCVDMCQINSTDDTFRCLCPGNTTLAPDLSDCFAGAEVPITQGSSVEFATQGLYYRYIELQNNTYILSNSMYVQSNGEMCVLFWLGEESQIVLTTNVVRGSGRIDMLALVDDNGDAISTPSLSSMLTSSVLVTGALLVGTGDCTVVGDTISVSASIQNTSSAIISTEDFFNGNASAVEQRAGELAVIFFLEQNAAITETAFSISEKVIVGTSVAAGLLLVGVCLILIITGSVKIIGRRSKKFTRVTRASHQKGVSHDRELRDITNSEAKVNSYGAPGPEANPTAERNLMVRSSLRSKLPPMLIIKSANLRILDPIGQGEFGIVYKGYLTEQCIDEVVAIKTLKGFIDASSVQEFLSECARMKNFSNLHVMSLKGVCLDGGPVPFIVLPYMANGSLAAYLKKERKNLVMVKDNSTSDVTTDSEDSAQVLFTRKRLMDMCLQVAKGMEYLASEKIVHRDLAARNCMIDINMIIKIADFGLSVNMGAKEYYRLTNHMDIKLPVKWMAPESLADYVFSEMSDVWSYGVTCWEIFTGAQVPYPGVRPSTLHSFLQKGERLAIPNNLACNDDLYSMMQWCWKMKPDKRPSFSTLVNTLSESLEKQADYLHVGAFTPDNNRDSLINHNFTNSNEEITTVTVIS